MQCSLWRVANSRCAALVFAMVALWLHPAVRSQTTGKTDPPYLSEMPAVEKVMGDMKIDDPIGSSARQASAFEELQRVIDDMAGPRGAARKYTPDEIRIRGQYALAQANLEKTVSTPAEHRAFFAARAACANFKFRNELLQKYFSAAFLAEYDKTHADFRARQKALAEAQKKEMLAPHVPAPRPPNQYDEAIGIWSKALGGQLGTIVGMLPKTPDGLRLKGRYSGQGGLVISFMPDVAAIIVGEVTAEREYKIELKNGQAVVTIHENGKPIILTLGADGKMTGSGDYVVSGWAYAGYKMVKAVDGRIDPYTQRVEEKQQQVYEPRPAAFTLGVLTPEHREAVPAGETTAVLSITLAISPRGGIPVSLAGRSFFLLKDEQNQALTKGGFQHPPGVSPRKAMEIARINNLPDLSKAVAAILADTACDAVATDVAGKAQFPPLTPGTYYLVGGIVDPRLGWNLKVELKPGMNALAVDEHSASPFE